MPEIQPVEPGPHLRAGPGPLGRVREGLVILQARGADYAERLNTAVGKRDHRTAGVSAKPSGVRPRTALRERHVCTGVRIMSEMDRHLNPEAHDLATTVALPDRRPGPPPA